MRFASVPRYARNPPRDDLGAWSASPVTRSAQCRWWCRWETAKFNALLTNAVIFHNALDIAEIVRQLQEEGHVIASEDLAHISPYLTEHIRRFGEYSTHELGLQPEAYNPRLDVDFSPLRGDDPPVPDGYGQAAWPPSHGRTAPCRWNGSDDGPPTVSLTAACRPQLRPVLLRGVDVSALPYQGRMVRICWAWPTVR